MSSDPLAKGKTTVDAADTGGRTRAGKLRWVFGWIIVPLLIVGVLFGSGVHVGARHPDMWMTRAVLWVFSGEAQRGPQTAEERWPMSKRMRLSIMPGKDHSMSVGLTPEELEALAAKAETSVEALECETACELLWAQEQPDKKLYAVAVCELEPATKTTPTKVKCDAKVEL